jgi:hypothetical protein
MHTEPWIIAEQTEHYLRVGVAYGVSLKAYLRTKRVGTVSLSEHKSMIGCEQAANRYATHNRMFRYDKI